MVVRIIESKEDKVITADLIAELKKSNKIDYSGAIFTFEGIVRGKEENMNLKKLILTTPDKEKTQSDLCRNNPQAQCPESLPEGLQSHGDPGHGTG